MEANQLIRKALYRLLRPLARILIAVEISYQQSSALLKKAYIESAEDDYAIPGRRTSSSRVSLITGLSRKAVKRVKGEAASFEDGDYAPIRGVQIVRAWVSDKNFSTERMAIGGEFGFAELVKKYSCDLPYRAVLDELLRVGIVEIDHNKKLTLMSEIYIPEQGRAEKFDLLAEGGRDYLNTAVFNLSVNTDDTRMQLTVAYNNLSDEAVKQFKIMNDIKTFELLQEFDEWLAKKEVEGSADEDDECGRRAGLGVYYFEE